MTLPAEQQLTAELAAKADRHLWGHFARHGHGITPPIITRGEGCTSGTATASATSTVFPDCSSCQVGHGRREIAEAAAKQAETLEFFPLWSYATPPAIELAERLAGYAPGDLNKVFFTTGGGEAVESAWKLAKQFFKLTGKPGKYKVISRAIAYHGTPQGALAITGLPDFKKPFEPLTPGGFRVPNTNFYRAPEPTTRHQGLGPLLRRPHRRGHRVRRPGHGVRRLPGTGAERRRLLPTAARILRAGPGDLR